MIRLGTSLCGFLCVVALVALPEAPGAASSSSDSLPSWSDGSTKQAIFDFVRRVTTEGGPDYVSPGDRIATFDNDGTLWVERPVYAQVRFGIERLGQRPRPGPGPSGYLELLVATHTGMTAAEFDAELESWISAARHPRYQRPYTETVYQPMLELLDYLRANDFQTWICTGGTVQFVRTFAEEVYGIPPQQIIGTSVVTRFEVPPTGPSELHREAAIHSFNNEAGKVRNIRLHIGKRPILAVGNSDGDLQMLQYISDGDGPKLVLLVRHDDEEREYAYDTGAEEALKDAGARDWTVISIRDDFRVLFPFERADAVGPESKQDGAGEYDGSPSPPGGSDGLRGDSVGRKGPGRDDHSQSAGAVERLE